MEDITGELTETTTLVVEDLEQRHKKERKELQGTVQKLKKSVSKGDKKQKKAVDEQIRQLEEEIHERHVKERESLLKSVSKIHYLRVMMVCRMFMLDMKEIGVKVSTIG